MPPLAPVILTRLPPIHASCLFPFLLLLLKPAPDSKENRNLTLCTPLPAPATVGFHLCGKERDKRDRLGTTAANLSGFRPACRLPGAETLASDCPPCHQGVCLPTSKPNDRLHSLPGSQYPKAYAPSLPRGPGGIAPGPLSPYRAVGRRKPFPLSSQACRQASQQ